MQPFDILMYNAYYYYITNKDLLIKLRKLEYIEGKEKKLDSENALTNESRNLEKDEVRILENKLNNMKTNSLFDEHRERYKLYLQYIEALV